MNRHDFYEQFERVLAQEKRLGSEYVTLQVDLPERLKGTGGAYRNDEEYLFLSAQRIHRMQEVAFRLGLNFYIEAHIDRVSEDPEGENFPWRPPPFSEVIGDSFLRGAETVGAEAIEGKYLGIYFSAHWCGPCRGFTPKLAETYLKLRAKRDDFEFVFSSGDQDQAAFDGYYKEQPDWLAVPFSDKKRRDALDRHFAVEGIPTFVIVDPAGKIINASGRAAVAADPEGNDFPWVPPAVAPLEAAGDFINEETTLIAMVGSLDDAGKEAALKGLTEVAEMTIADAKSKKKDPEMRFAIAKSNDGIAERIVELTKISTDKPQLLILDIPDNGGFYVADVDEVNQNTITAFMADKGARKQLGE